jgi:heat-inducible transcriptional repressor
MTREDQILKLIVEHFIKTAEPVGSQTLLEVYHLPFSSATIRNDELP